MEQMGVIGELRMDGVKEVPVLSIKSQRGGRVGGWMCNLQGLTDKDGEDSKEPHSVYLEERMGWVEHRTPLKNEKAGSALGECKVCVVCSINTTGLPLKAPVCGILVTSSGEAADYNQLNTPHFQA